jgi:alpha-N-arabinofuranosidase
MPRRVHRLISWMVCASFAALSTGAHAQGSVEVAVKIRADQPGPVINPNIYGQFAEHLGAGIYEGVWVGEKSSIPNTHGYRNDVIAALKALKVPVVRWPGGCFADEYHWRDGIGPREKRPVKVNTHWGGVPETNEFGTHEFMTFAEMIGTKVYISGNVGSGSPQEMADWMEYMTSGTVSTLANERRKNGRDKPWDVHFFGIGNETWGCGGNMRPEYYADLFRQYATYVKAPRGKRMKIVASGGATRAQNGSKCSRPWSAGHGRSLTSLLRLRPASGRTRATRSAFPKANGSPPRQHAQDRRIHHQQREGAGPERSGKQGGVLCRRVGNLV